MEPKQLVDRVYGYFERKFIGLLVVVAGIAGLALVEFFCRFLSGSTTYYQEHSFPRLVGAGMAFVLSNAVVWVAKWSKDEIHPSYIRLPSRQDRERVGLVCYAPYVLFIVCVILALVDVT